MQRWSDMGVSSGSPLSDLPTPPTPPPALWKRRRFPSAKPSATLQATLQGLLGRRRSGADWLAQTTVLYGHMCVYVNSRWLDECTGYA